MQHTHPSTSDLFLVVVTFVIVCDWLREGLMLATCDWLGPAGRLFSWSLMDCPVARLYRTVEDLILDCWVIVPPALFKAGSLPLRLIPSD